MKLEMNRAWSGTVRLLKQNREVVLVVAGVFFFLPYLAFMLIAPDPWAGVSDAQARDTEAMVARVSAFYSQVWWVIALILVLQAVGMLGLLALLSDRRRPTVGEALGIGARKVLSYIAAYLLLGMGLTLAVMVLAAISAIGGAQWLQGLIVVLAFLAWVFLFVRFSLVGPVLVKERLANPIAALRRSWQLTRGNTWRLLVFFALLVIATFVVTIVASTLIGVFFGLFGAESAKIGDGLVVSLINAGWATLFLGVISAVHDQFAGTAPTVSVPTSK